MAISIKRYVDITSGVGGNSGVRKRDLIARLFTTNPLLPTGSFAEFTSADDVATYFGSASEEYLRAVFYFGWISKNISAPKKISFARWVSADVAPLIYGKPAVQAIATWNAITNGAFGLTMGAFTFSITGLNFSTDVTLAAVASRIQTAIRAQAGGALWTTATVSYDAVRQSFNLVGGATGVAVISATAAVAGTDIANLLGWLTGAILSNGAVTETITTTLSNSVDASNNFGSFAFIPALTINQIVEAAQWNDAQNIMYQYHVPVTAANAASWSAALLGIGGVALTLDTLATEYHEMIPMAILAATAYDKRNSVQNYMFQQFGVTPTVTKNADANIYDPLRVNYYGRTQTAGQFLDFYQRGVMMGIATDAVDMNVFANEQWLKDEAGASIMELLLSLAKVSANTEGRSQLIAVLQTVIDQALFNGSISVGKTLNTTQKLYIGQITGDDNAWQQIQAIGYWFDVVFQSYVTTDGRTEFKAVYTLVYAKDDTIRKVEGTHVLI